MFFFCEYLYTCKKKQQYLRIYTICMNLKMFISIRICMVRFFLYVYFCVVQNLSNNFLWQTNSVSQFAQVCCVYIRTHRFCSESRRCQQTCAKSITTTEMNRGAGYNRIFVFICSAERMKIIFHRFCISHFYVCMWFIYRQWMANAIGFVRISSFCDSFFFNLATLEILIYVEM